MSLIPFILDLADELREFQRGIVGDMACAMDVDDFGSGLLVPELLQTLQQPQQLQQSQQQQQQHQQRRSRSLSQLFFGGSKLHSQRHHPYAASNKVGTSPKDKEQQGANGAGSEAGGGGGEKASQNCLSSSQLSSIASAASASPDFFRKLNNPTIVNKNGWVMVSMNVKQFTPDEITVKTIDNCIVIEGKHGEKEDMHGVISRHFIRKYILPKGYNPNEVSSTMSSDGILTVKAPPPALPSPKEVVVSDGKNDASERIVDIQQIPDTATASDLQATGRPNDAIHSSSVKDVIDTLAPSKEAAQQCQELNIGKENAVAKINTGIAGKQQHADKPDQNDSEQQNSQQICIVTHNAKLEKEQCALENEMQAENREKQALHPYKMHEDKVIAISPGVLQMKPCAVAVAPNDNDALADADMEGDNVDTTCTTLMLVAENTIRNNNDAKSESSLVRKFSESAVVGDLESAAKASKAATNQLDIETEATTTAICVGSVVAKGSKIETLDAQVVPIALTKSNTSAKTCDAGEAVATEIVLEMNAERNKNGVGLAANAVKTIVSIEKEDVAMETDNTVAAAAAAAPSVIDGDDGMELIKNPKHLNIIGSVASDPSRIEDDAADGKNTESNGINTTGASSAATTILLTKTQCEENGTSTTVATATENPMIAAATI